MLHFVPFVDENELGDFRKSSVNSIEHFDLVLVRLAIHDKHNSM